MSADIAYWAIFLIFFCLTCWLLASAHRLGLRALEQQSRSLTQPTCTAPSARERFELAHARYRAEMTPDTYRAMLNAEEAWLLDVGA